jgi:hypothetical protein
MAYATNLPDKGQPRGLGELGHQAAGFGTWVVDMHWGLSPKNITGQNRPYGPGVIQTFYPRSQDPRLLNLSMGPVVPGGSWPTLQPTSISPVFRTPLARSGQKQESIPPLGLQGYGYLPLGIAQPPVALLERGEPRTIPYEQMPPMLQGYGQAGGEGVTVGAEGGTQIPITKQDIEFVMNNPQEARKIFFSMSQALVAARNIEERYQLALSSLYAVGDENAEEEALTSVYGGEDSRRSNLRVVAGLETMRSMFSATFTPEEISTWPSDVQRSYNAFMRHSPGFAGYSGFGQAGEGIAALLVGTGGLVAMVAGAKAAGTAGLAGFLVMKLGLTGVAAATNVIGWAVILAFFAFFALALAGVAMIGYAIFGPSTRKAVAQVNGSATQANTASKQSFMAWCLGRINQWEQMRANAMTDAQREFADSRLASWQSICLGAKKKDAQGDKEETDARGGFPMWVLQAGFVGLSAIFAYFLVFRGGPKAVAQGTNTAAATATNFAQQVAGAASPMGAAPAPQQRTGLWGALKGALGMS